MIHFSLLLLLLLILQTGGSCVSHVSPFAPPNVLNSKEFEAIFHVRTLIAAVIYNWIYIAKRSSPPTASSDLCDVTQCVCLYVCTCVWDKFLFLFQLKSSPLVDRLFFCFFYFFLLLAASTFFR